MNSAIRAILALFVLFGWSSVPALAAPAILQHGYDTNVSNANLAESALNATSVTSGTFGRLYSLAADDKITAQPLYVPNVTTPGFGQRNLLIVAAMSDTVYAFDADNAGAALWTVNLAGLYSTTAAPWANFGISTTVYSGNLGILSTPVVDPATNILYVVACTLESGTLAYRLHAIDIRDGSEPYGPGVLIQASYGGVTFNARYQTQRASLALAGNPASQVIVAFGAMEEESVSTSNYVGWVMAYQKLTLQQTGAFAVITNGNGGGGTWQGGRPPAVDSDGNFYVFTGNAWGGGYDGVGNFSESVLKFSVSSGLQLLDWFTPSNWKSLDNVDNDLSSSGPILIPGTSPPLLAGGGKSGDLYVLNSANLGKYVPNDTQVVQKMNITRGTQGIYQIRSGPAYWNRSVANGGPLMYDWGGNDTLKAFAFDGSRFSTSPVATSGYLATLPGGAVSLSANGSQPGSGIVWATRKDQTQSGAGGVLHAFDAANVATELWNSAIYPTRDAVGGYVPHVVPVVANGKVYVASGANKVNVYGLGVAPAAFTLTPTSLSFGNVQVNSTSPTQAVTVRNASTAALGVIGISIAGPMAAQFSQTNNCGTSIAAGASCVVYTSFTPSATGSQAAWLNVNLRGPGIQATALTGTGVAASFSVLPASLTFGNVPAGALSAAQTVTVTNSGSVALSLGAPTFSGANPSQFLLNNLCAGTVAAGASCAIQVQFAPTAAGGQSATLNVTAGGVMNTVTLSGTGTVSYGVSPTALSFGNVNTGTTSTLNVTVTNTGAAALPITGITIAGANAGQFAQTNSCATPVAPGSTCTVYVTFSPVATGIQTATLTLSAAAGSQSVALSGTGAAMATLAFTLTPASVPFGTVTAGTPSTLPVTVTNTGSAPVTISGIAFTGGSPGNFSQTNTCSAPVSAGATCTINVVFTPSVSGYLVSNLAVTGAGGAGTHSIGVNGTGTVPFTASPTPLAFGNVPVGMPGTPGLVTVTNTGTVTMPAPVISFVNAGASSYAQTNSCGATIAAGASCTVSVTFTPTAAGVQSAVMKLKEFSVVQSVALSGKGI